MTFLARPTGKNTETAAPSTSCISRSRNLNRTIHSSIVSAPASTRVEADSDDGVHQVLEPITDGSTAGRLAKLLEDKKVWIADGHHRYETACTFREGIGQRDGLIPEDFMMM